MEAVLEEFYAQIVDKLERDELIPAYKRTQYREYVAIVVEGLCGPWCGQDKRKACEAAILGAVTHHNRAVCANGSVCPLGKHHDILYVMARLALDAKAGPGPVSTLLNAIYKCEKTLEKLFEGAVVGSKVARMISGRRTDFGATAAENRQAMAFFLDRVTRTRLLLDGQRPADVKMGSYRASPVVVATAAGDVDAVALLLRYGAADTSVRAAIAYLRDTADTHRPLSAGSRSCLEILRRATLYEDSYHSKYLKVLQPPALMHLARHVVRHTLYANFNLPHGIRQLPIPQSLVSYLNLEC
ncbi:uncharacterized protein LOC126896797 [Daktulosphaira vitifoliae]|uniref:uncharacterized protein LOC126896797 n=1 Tax=Daktulosphaira vitifoliae TaxID=58002 RepID=UPI0021A9FD59|nr:uncharacterized protein LOC126896797 [Daktulosphaira vitifoliae]